MRKKNVLLQLKLNIGFTKTILLLLIFLPNIISFQTESIVVSINETIKRPTCSLSQQVSDLFA